MKAIATRIARLIGGLLLLGTVLVAYNYLRHIVYWHPTEEVAFSSADGTELRGTLIMPSAEGVHPAVVMLHGSGPESRSGPAYHVLSNAIVRSGVGVLFYDKRGVGESDGDFDSATYEDFVADASAAVGLLASRDDIDPAKIGLHGNSEGGWLAPEIAYSTGQVAFIFNRVGPALPWMQNVIWEVRNDLLAAGVAESDVEPLLAITLRRWNYYLAAAEDPTLVDSPERDEINAELKRLIETVPGADSELPDSLAEYDPELYADIAAEVGYDQTPYLEALDIPMIYTFGETDINVPTAESVAYLEAFRKAHGKDIDIVVFEGVGHPMAHWTGMFQGGYIPAFMELLHDWYSAQAVR